MFRCMRRCVSTSVLRYPLALRPAVCPAIPIPTSRAASQAARGDDEPFTDITSVPQKIQLRDYQEECIRSVLSSFENGSKRVGVSLATGAGKTVIFTQLIDRVTPPLAAATQTLILAHRRELVEQAARHCTRAYPDKSIEIELGNAHASGTADIIIASVQSINSKDRILKYDPGRFKLVLVDEAHHIVAPSYLKILEHFGLSRKHANSPLLVGVSATFSRFDGLRLGAAIDEIVYHRDYVDMIGDKWLSDVVFTTVKSTADLSKVSRRAMGDFLPGSLSKAVNTDEINEITVRSWMAKAAGRKSTLVFCVDLAHVTGLTRKFRQYGLDARFVTGDTHQVERSERLEAFRRGEFPVLVNCSVFTEGTDIPNVDCVVLARPTRSRNLLVQMIGRGMRLHPGKGNCQVIDMVSSLETGIVTTPTLFGLDPGELVDEATVDDMRTLKDRRQAEEDRLKQAYQGNIAPSAPSVPRKVTFTEYDSVFDLIDDTSAERHIRAISQYAWAQVSPDRYILCGPDRTYLRLQRIRDPETDRCSGFYHTVEVRALPPGLTKTKSPFAAPREILQATTFSDAVHGSDKYASEAFPHMFISRHGKWRQGPATEGQLKFLNKLRKKEDQLTEDGLTKGKAADMITKVKHGARGRFAELETGRRRRERKMFAAEQDRERVLQEVVQVGPLEA